MERQTLIINCDGGARGNPGPAAAAFAAAFNGRVVAKQSKYLGETTNNVAEYSAVLLALKWFVKSDIKHKTLDIRFVLDSELITKQLNGEYKVKNEKLRDLYHSVKELEKNISLEISYTHVVRSKNKLADFLVNRELDNRI